MSDIPSELVTEILSRIPNQPLLRFRSVCKSWRNIIDDPSFIKSHRHRYRFSSTGLDHLILRSNETTKLFFLPLESLRGKKRITASNRPQFSRPGLSRLCSFPAASCDGMILLTHSKAEKAWAVWNPLNGDFRGLPPCHSDVTNVGIGGFGMLTGFGYDFVSDDYKVVRVGRLDGNNGLETQVYSLKSGYWRRIEDFSGSFFMGFDGVCSEGVLYWMIKVEQQRRELVDRIIAFDLGAEAHSILSLPAIF